MQYRSVTVLAPAKLNLSLDVVGTLPTATMIWIWSCRRLICMKKSRCAAAMICP